MKRYLLLLLLPLLIYACASGDKAPAPFSKEMLQKQIYSVNPNRDTVLETLHGALIRISSGSFSVSGDVTLEIREAFTPAEILAAGLTTESNGRPLISGGMIYINSVSEGVSVIKPIKVSVPNKFYDPKMEIFKGVETDSGRINWTELVKPDSTPQAANWALGKTIFRTKCYSCHSIFKEGTGPALINVEDRGPWEDREKIRDFIRNPAAYMSRSSYVQDLKRKYGSVMTAYPNMSDTAINALLSYIKNESQRPGAREEEQNFLDSLAKTRLPDEIKEGDSLTNTTNHTEYTGPCRVDTLYINPKKQEQSFLATTDPLPTTNLEQDTITQQGPAKAESVESLRTGFTDPNPTDGMYDFEIRTFG